VEFRSNVTCLNTSIKHFMQMAHGGLFARSAWRVSRDDFSHSSHRRFS
jgi:hypothetical protein